MLPRTCAASLLVLLSCSNSPPLADLYDAGPRAEAIVVSTTSLAPVPAQTLIVRLGGAGLGSSVTVRGTIRNTLALVDRDKPVDDAFPFVIRCYDNEGRLVFQSSRREPIQIREFLGQFRLGFDPFLLFPELGDVGVLIPNDPSITTVKFVRRERDGTEKVLGESQLSTVEEVPRLDAVVTALHKGGDPNRSLDIAILGDGYRQSELPMFAEHAAAVAAEFLATEPYASLRDRVNIHRIDVASEESGASYDCSETATIEGCADLRRNTAFGSAFPLRLAALFGAKGLWDVPLFQLDQQSVHRAAANTPYDALVVLVNTKKYGGFGVYAASLTAHDPNTPGGVVHEFGHAFGLLADEYTNESSPCQRYQLTPDFPNMSILLTNESEVKWSSWLTPGVPLPTPSNFTPADAVGLFPGVGGGCSDLYKPRRTCRMRSWTEPMCPVCAEQTVSRMLEMFDVSVPSDVVLEKNVLRMRAPTNFGRTGAMYIGDTRVAGIDEALTLTRPASPPYETSVRVVTEPTTTWSHRKIEPEVMTVKVAW